MSRRFSHAATTLTSYCAQALALLLTGISIGAAATPPIVASAVQESLNAEVMAAVEQGIYPQTRPQIAIIIDDIGYNLTNGLRAVQLPAPLTLAILPHTPNGVSLAEEAHKRGKEIMLHAPMTTESGRTLGPGALTPGMDKNTFLSTLREDIDAIPHVSGVNNHMGSELTQDAYAMRWLMGELKQRQLFFIDSRTTASSVALATAIDYQLPSLKRDVFLDNQRDPNLINQQLDQLLQLARRRGYAVGIGHPYPETLATLEKRLPALTGVTLVPVSSLLYTPSPLRQTPQLVHLPTPKPVSP